MAIVRHGAAAAKGGAHVGGPAGARAGSGPRAGAHRPRGLLPTLLRLTLAGVVLFVTFLILLPATNNLPDATAAGGRGGGAFLTLNEDGRRRAPVSARRALRPTMANGTMGDAGRRPSDGLAEERRGSDPPEGREFIDPERIEVISSEHPRAYLYHGFLTEEECDHIVEKAKPNVVRSGVVDASTGQSKTDDVRTSSGTFFSQRADATITRVEKRLADWTMLPEGNSEGIQVLRYEASQQYRPHYDYFFHDAGKKNNRIATVLMYLSDVAQGGETVFPHADPSQAQRDAPPGTYSECAMQGLAVKPKKGDALLFWTLKVGGELDHGSNHGGCPVIEGVKWSATKWIHVGHLSSHRTGHAEFHEPRNLGPPKFLADGSPCVDTNGECEMWAEDGECKKNPGFMHAACPLSCDTCETAQAHA